MMREQLPEGFEATRELVIAILEKAHAFEWTVQGFGMMRTKLRDRARLHVWSKALQVPDVSLIHDHPWPLRSTIIAGWLKNVKYAELSPEVVYTTTHYRQMIATGEGGGPIDGTVMAVHLSLREAMDYFRGDTYTQAPAEVHSSHPEDGCVTLMERPMGPPLQRATVYWLAGKSWVSAEPRPATDAEVHAASVAALETIHRDLEWERKRRREGGNL